MWTIITNWSNGTFETIITQPTKKQNLVDLCQLLCRIWCQKYQNDWFEFGRQDKINADSEKNVWFEVCKSQRVVCFELKQIRIECGEFSSGSRLSLCYFLCKTERLSQKDENTKKILRFKDIQRNSVKRAKNMKTWDCARPITYIKIVQVELIGKCNLLKWREKFQRHLTNMQKGKSSFISPEYLCKLWYHYH